MTNPTNNLEEKIAEIVREYLPDDHDDCDESCSKKWYEQNAINELTTELKALFTSYANEVADERVRKYVDLLELAWGIIANSYNGDWTTASKEWQDAAARWRDEYHNVLNQLRRGE